MEESRQEVEVLSADQIIAINRVMISNTGGFFTPPNNLLHKNSLYWVLDIIQHPVSFGVNRHPTLFNKAAVLAWTIITRHVFVDGNKRTGMIGAQVFMLVNNYFLNMSNAEIEDMALRIVAYQENGFSVGGLSEWLETNSVYFTQLEDL